ncbi:MAG: SUMF1/EgtB/PvdO family nonheme iron enzyme [Desulfovibrionaceae bacterium]|nr:SUMF1/EgtB/PvdO family nonheme iron enzyme [Desulfovibrionaceae bacterium]
MIEVVMRQFFLFILLLVCFGADICFAQGLQRKGKVTPEAACNPAPLPDDLILPMPCGLEMAFRAVAVPVDGYLNDLETRFGCADCERSGEEFYDRQYSQGISGPFRLENLPQAWRSVLQSASSTADRQVSYQDKALYLLAKYEVSNLQWDAVMGVCPDEPQKLPPDAARPKAMISWYDAVDFTRRYMDWLLTNHQELLPRFEGDGKNIAYLRLPTETEWEYAARGGHMVSLESLRNENFFERDQSLPLSEFAVFQADDASRAAENPENIGSRRPNPLGLYDMPGNLAEITLDPFQFSLGGRLGGSSGGFVRKGGSFMTGLSEIMPGRREEVPFYLISGPAMARDMGVRPVISGINTPGGARPELLRREWAGAGSSSPFVFDSARDPLAEIDRLLAETDSDREKEMLSALRGVIKDNNIALERQQEKAAGWHIRSAMHTVGSIRNFFIRRKTLSNQLEALRLQQSKADDAAYQEKLGKSIREHQEFIAMLDQAINTTVGHYRVLVEESAVYPREVFDRQMKLAQEDVSGQEWHSKEMQNCLARFIRHVGLLRENKMSALTVQALRKDMVSAEYQ